MRPEPSAEWNRKLILARGGVSLLAGILTTSSNITANFIGSELVAPSPQPCNITGKQDNRMALAAESKRHGASLQVCGTEARVRILIIWTSGGPIEVTVTFRAVACFRTCRSRSQKT